MQLVFVCATVPFDGDALETRGLGGTETALIGIARALAQLPSCKADVFCMTNPGDPSYDGAFVAAISKLLDDADLRDAMSQAAIRKAAHLTYEALARDWLRDFGRRLERAPAPGKFSHGELPSLAGVRLTSSDGTRSIEFSASEMRAHLARCVAPYGYSTSS